jgi:YD repeat-containing protein
MVRNSRQSVRCHIHLLCVIVLVCVNLLALASVSAQTGITYVYDELGRLVAVIDQSGDTAKYGYDAVGNLLSISRYSSSTLSIIHFTPKQGPVGTVVTIYGTSFSSTPSQNTVTFNGVAATVTSASATQIATTVPAGATTGLIAITTPSASITSDTSFTVTTSTAPTITSFTPIIGTPGTAVSISGTNFESTLANNSVIFNTHYALLSSANSTTISTSVPAQATSGRISVATPAGKATSVADFFVPPAPFGVSDVAVTDRMTFGDSKTVTISPANKIGLFLFAGTALQKATLKVNSFSMTSTNLVVYKPNGEVLLSTSIFSNGGLYDTPVLPATGTYTILIDPTGTNTGSIGFTLYNSTDTTGTITPGGSAVTVTTSVIGQNARLTFNGTAGQRVSFQFSNSTFTGCLAVRDYIKNPDETTLTSLDLCSASGFIDTAVLPTTGTYSILIDPQGTTTGSQTLTLYDVPADVTGTITPGGSSVTVTNTVPGQNGILTFSGTAGHQVSLRISNSTFTGCIGVTNTIKKPDGTNLTSASLCSAAGFFDTQVQPVTGTYTILIDPGTTNVGSETLLLYDVPADVTASITPGGASVTLTTTTPGQNGRATFDGTANQRVSLKVTGVSLTGGTNNWVTVSIKKPDGTTLAWDVFSSSGGFIDVQTLPATGTYTVLADLSDTSTGSVTLTLYDVPADVSVSITPNGTPTTITNTTPGQNGVATFTATANQRVSLNINTVSLTGGAHNWVTISIKKPDGSTLVSNVFASSGGFIDMQTLTTAGTYTILVDPADSSVGSVTITLNDVPADATGTITVGGSALTLTTTVPGQNALPTFSGTSNQQVSIVFTSNTMGTVVVNLLKPDGTTLTSTTSASSSFTLSTQTLPTTGTYSIKIDPNGASIGSITVSVTEITNSATLQADYQFQNTRSSSVGSPPALTDIGGTNSFTTATVDATSTTVLSFAQNNGLSLSSTSGVVPSSTYSIVMLFSFNTTSSFRRIADFKNGTSDTGLYANGGKLYLYNGSQASSVSIAANTYVQVVLTRDSAGTVTGYVDGVQQIQFSDSGGLGTINSSNTLRLFKDDGSEASAGTVARIRLYDGALSAAEVAALSRLP